MGMQLGRGRRRSSIRMPAEELQRLMERVCREAVEAGTDPGGVPWIAWIGFNASASIEIADDTAVSYAVAVCAVSREHLLFLHGFRLRVGERLRLRFMTNPPMRRRLVGRVVQCRTATANVYVVLLRFTSVGRGRRLVEIIEEARSRQQQAAGTG